MTRCLARPLGLAGLLLAACSTSSNPPDLARADGSPADLGPGPPGEASVGEGRAGDQAPPLPAWSKQLGSSAADHARALAVDGAGNLYLAGFTEGSVGGPAAGAEDVLLIKLGADGHQIWARQLGSSQRDMGLGVALDASGAIYVTGSTSGDLQGSNAGNDGTCKTPSCPDLFLWKVDPDQGATLWIRQLGSRSDDTANGIAADGSGIYLTGKTAGSLDGQVSAGWNDVFLIKYSAQGQKLWVRQFGGASFDEGRAVAADGKGQLLVTGYLSASAGNDDVFLSRRSSLDGEELWRRTLASAGGKNEEGYAVALDPDGGAVVCGYTMGALPGGSLTGFSDLFLARWSADGSPGWVKQLGASQVKPAQALCSAVVVQGGRVMAAGSSNGTLPGGLPSGGYDLFLLGLRLDGSGELELHQLGTAADDRAYALAGQGSQLLLGGDTGGAFEGQPMLGGTDILIKQLQL